MENKKKYLRLNTVNLFERRKVEGKGRRKNEEREKEKKD